MMRFDKKSTPVIRILIAGHTCLVFISPPGANNHGVLHDGDEQIMLGNKF
jgi:hypothetical protein